MSVSALVFSRDRAAQLDLALRSMSLNIGTMLGDVVVLWKASSAKYEAGYEMCEEMHPSVQFVQEQSFSDDTIHVVKHLRDDYAMFVMDDAVCYRRFDHSMAPEELLDDINMMCVSLRLGLNTGNCYPLKRMQGLPDFWKKGDALVWKWQTGDADFGYPGSCDTHIFRRHELTAMLNYASGWSNPNTMEDALVKGCTLSLRPLMSCYEASHVVGLPVNRVNETHLTNRYGEAHFEPERLLNSKFLNGRRLSLGTVDPARVTGAHTEFELQWEAS